MKLGLGTVQWGMNYGVANRQGKTSSAAVKEILIAAKQCNVLVLDTASLYGDAEETLGQHNLNSFRIVTKTPKFSVEQIEKHHCENIKQVFMESLSKLGVKKIYALLGHHVDDFLVPNGFKLWGTMLDLKRSDMVEKIGVSVYNSQQVEAVLENYQPDIMQIPISVLDQRMLIDGTLQRLQERGIEVHVRSVFMQGLLLMPDEKIPSYFDPIRGLLSKWRAAAQAQDMSLSQAALSFVRDLAYVDTVLIGIEDVDQFLTCYREFINPAQFDATGLACDDLDFINPANWKLG